MFAQVFIACGLSGSSSGPADPFRKPELGMWHVMEKHFNSGISIDKDQLFFPFPLFLCFVSKTSFLNSGQNFYYYQVHSSIGIYLP